VQSFQYILGKGGAFVKALRMQCLVVRAYQAIDIVSDEQGEDILWLHLVPLGVSFNGGYEHQVLVTVIMGHKYTIPSKAKGDKAFLRNEKKTRGGSFPLRLSV
jgi:hypothetical protein